MVMIWFVCKLVLRSRTRKRRRRFPKLSLLGRPLIYLSLPSPQTTKRNRGAHQRNQNHPIPSSPSPSIFSSLAAPPFLACVSSKGMQQHWLLTELKNRNTSMMSWRGGTPHQPSQLCLLFQAQLPKTVAVHAARVKPSTARTPRSAPSAWPKVVLKAARCHDCVLSSPSHWPTLRILQFESL
jgi:hypothetical protein